jgi:hypothetical protein
MTSFYIYLCHCLLTDSNGISKCGNLTIEQPALLGRNITLSFTPDSHDPVAILEWQRAAKAEGNLWYTRPLTYKFTQYNESGTYYMVLTDSAPKDDEVYYRIHYYNESMHCWMETGKLELDGMLILPLMRYSPLLLNQYFTTSVNFWFVNLILKGHCLYIKRRSYFLASKAADTLVKTV